MKLIKNSRGHRTRVGSVVVAFVAWSGAAQNASADKHHYVMPDGTRIPLVRSENELGVVLREGASVKAAGARLRAAGLGEMKDIAGASRSRLKIVRVADVSKARRDRIGQQADVRNVGVLYRYADSGAPAISTGTIVVRTSPDLTAAQRADLWTAYGLGSITPLRGMPDIYRVAPTDPTVDEVLLAERMAGDARTVWANPNFRNVMVSTQVVASDPLVGFQWYLDNNGSRPGLVEDADIDAPEAWTVATGSGVLFGMTDDACDVTHEDLRANYIGVGQDLTLPPGVAGASDPAPKFPGEYHGTSVMGLAAAAGNNLGVRGVAFNARFTATRGTFLSQDFAVASAYTFALEQGVDVHINSWGFVFPVATPPVLVDAIEFVIANGRDPDGNGPEPPLGMVVVFSSGNDNRENRAGFAISTVAGVLSVGASSSEDRRSSFSNFGRELDVLAPGGDFFSELIATTDNEDTNIEPGFNVGGFTFDPITGQIVPDIDPGGKYTGTFIGTSAACPVAAGVAGLVLSANPELTANEVVLVVEHTCDKVSPDDAQYNTIGNRSLTYGYGRVNAGRAVRAARLAKDNGATWPDAPKNLQVLGTLLQWRPGAGTSEFLVLQSDSAFGFIPTDDACYDSSQFGCASTVPTALPDDVSVLFVGCDGECAAGDAQSVEFVPPEGGRKFFALFGRNDFGQYSFGVGIDSAGIETGEPEDPSLGGSTTRPPAITISVSPLSGKSPLTVRFNGNATTDPTTSFDPDKIAWDFDVDGGITRDAPSKEAEHTYVVEPGEGTKVFRARLTMFDLNNRSGTADVLIRVEGPPLPDEGEGTGATGLRIVATAPGSPGTELTEGQSPLDVDLRLDIDSVNGVVESVDWDLGDGTRRAGFGASHTYVNHGTSPQTFVVIATVTAVTPGGARILDSASQLLTVHPGASIADEPVDATLPGTMPLGDGGSASPCGALGLLPLLLCVVSLRFMRRR